MNMQMAVAVEKSVTHNKVSVKELFATIQGEGPFSGYPAVFLRLENCNILCQFCDTDYTHGREWEIEDLLIELKKIKNNISLCVITGGEPLRQANIGKLINAVFSIFSEVQIETNGTCFQPDLLRVKSIYGPRLSIVCSPKTFKVHKELDPLINHFKLLICMEQDEPRIVLMNETRPLADCQHWLHRDCFVQPLDERCVVKNARNQQAAIWVAQQYNVPLSVQIHKILNVR